MALKEETKRKQEQSNKLVTGVVGKGWQLVREVANQNDTEKLLRAAARRVGLVVEVNKWPDGHTVVYRVTRKAES
jgi:hypothetical protein